MRLRLSVRLLLVPALAGGLHACRPFDASLLHERVAHPFDAMVPDATSIDAGDSVAPCIPVKEKCNRIDDDCDTKIDEGDDPLIGCQQVIVHADTACVPVGKTASCVRLDCHPGFDDCDGNPANGCEVPYCMCHDCKTADGDAGSDPSTDGGSDSDGGADAG